MLFCYKHPQPDSSQSGKYTGDDIYNSYKGMVVVYKEYIFAGKGREGSKPPAKARDKKQSQMMCGNKVCE